MAAAAGRVFQFKLVLLGDSAVGKSSLVLRFVRGQFFEYQESTIGAAFLTQTVALNDTTVKFEIWDTAGQERYHSLAPMYYRGAAAAVVVYDITNRDTFQRAKQWVKELQRQGNANIVIALAGNKSDLSSKRKVEPEEAESYASDNGIFFMETSAKTATNVNELFVAIARKLPKNTPQPRAGVAGTRRPIYFSLLKTTARSKLGSWPCSSSYSQPSHAARSDEAACGRVRNSAALHALPGASSAHEFPGASSAHESRPHAR